MSNPNDLTRDAILRYLYSIHKSAKGPKGMAAGIRDLHAAMKKQLGAKQQDVNSNLDYLVQKGWVVPVEKISKFTTKGGFAKENTSTKYKISHLGIDQLEAASLYKRDESYSGINITNVGGVTVLGSNNHIVNTHYTEVAGLLNQLEKEVAATDKISEETKLNIISDISTIQSQLSKPSPDKGIVSTAWKNIERLVVAGHFIELMHKISAGIGNLLG